MWGTLEKVENSALIPEWKTCGLSWLQKAMRMVNTQGKSLQCYLWLFQSEQCVQCQDNMESDNCLKEEDGTPTGLDESECCPLSCILKPYYKANYVRRKAVTLKAVDLEAFQKSTNSFLCSDSPPQYSVIQRARAEENQVGNQSNLPMIKQRAENWFAFLDLSCCFLKQTRGSDGILRNTIN